MKTNIALIFAFATASVIAHAETESWEYAAKPQPHSGRTSVFGLALLDAASIDCGYRNYSGESILYPSFEKKYFNDSTKPELFGCSLEGARTRELLSRGIRCEYTVQSMDSKNLKKLQRELNLSDAQIAEASNCTSLCEAKSRALEICSISENLYTQKLSFTRANKSGSGWVMETLAEAQFLAPLFMHGRPEIRARVSLKLDSCDGQKIFTSASHDKTLPLDALIEQFEEVDFKNFWQCTLIPASSPIIKQAQFWEGSRNQITALNPLEVIVTPEDRVILQSGSYNDSWRVQYTRVKEPQADMPGKRMAMEATQTFISLIKNHGRIIVRAATAGASQAEIQRLAQASLSAHKAEILAQLRTLNENYETLTLIEKLSVSASVQKAYDYVQAIELRVGKLLNERERLNLDGMINSSQGSSPERPIVSGN